MGAKFYNISLFVAKYAHEKKINRILIDARSAVNVMLLHTLEKLNISTDELMDSYLMIQGFNQDRRRAIGKLNISLKMDQMESSAIFHVIDTKTTYNLLLGSPWLHHIRLLLQNDTNVLSIIKTEKRLKYWQMKGFSLKLNYTSQMKNFIYQARKQTR